MGAALMALLGITSTDFSNLAWLVLICNLTSLLPLPLLGLLPKSLDRDLGEEGGGTAGGGDEGGGRGGRREGEEGGGGQAREEEEGGGATEGIEMGGLVWRAGQRRSGDMDLEERSRQLLLSA